ncbi:hypothetical protein J2853_001975 [Streptosporangium lutulentum]|uniref:Uncharacterized protein n=1 Tax=Streptosporangium lutulentum TaxID=1461250 RepID=A0ABT9Q9K2_9ACTN|nr:hypothetical protein [Streptosporangium lutulentum]
MDGNAQRTPRSGGCSPSMPLSPLGVGITGTVTAMKERPRSTNSGDTWRGPNSDGDERS